MSELDLSKAIESGSAVSSVKWEMDEGGRKIGPYPYAKVAAETKRILAAALPDILDALAEQAEAEAAAARPRRFLPRMANGEPFPDMSEAARAARWLSTKAAELRA